jgi:hypothetical protein
MELTQEQNSNIYRFIALMSTTEEYFIYVSELFINMQVDEYRKKLILERNPVKDYEYRIIDKRCNEKRAEVAKHYNKLTGMFKSFSKEFSSMSDDAMVQILIDNLNDDILKISIT